MSKEDLNKRLDELETKQQIQAEMMIAEMLDIKPQVNSSTVPNISFIARRHKLAIFIDFFNLIKYYHNKGQDEEKITESVLNIVDFVVDRAKGMCPKVVFIFDSKYPNYWDTNKFTFSKLFDKLIRRECRFAYDAYGNNSLNVLKTLADEYATVKKHSLVITSYEELNVISDDLTAVVNFKLEPHKNVKKRINNFNLASVINCGTFNAIKYYFSELKKNNCIEL